MTGLDVDAAARAARRTRWRMVAIFGVPGVAFAIWYLAVHSAALKDGTYSCEPETALTAGQFWTATVENEQLVDMDWDGPGDFWVVAFSFGAQHGAEEFTASVGNAGPSPIDRGALDLGPNAEVPNGQGVTCEYRK